MTGPHTLLPLPGVRCSLETYAITDATNFREAQLPPASERKTITTRNIWRMLMPIGERGSITWVALPCDMSKKYHYTSIVFLHFVSFP